MVQPPIVLETGILIAEKIERVTRVCRVSSMEALPTGKPFVILKLAASHEDEQMMKTLLDFSKSR